MRTFRRSRRRDTERPGGHHGRSTIDGDGPTSVVGDHWPDEPPALHVASYGAAIRTLLSDLVAGRTPRSLTLGVHSPLTARRVIQ